LPRSISAPLQYLLSTGHVLSAVVHTPLVIHIVRSRAFLICILADVDGNLAGLKRHAKDQTVLVDELGALRFYLPSLSSLLTSMLSKLTSDILAYETAGVTLSFIRTNIYFIAECNAYIVVSIRTFHSKELVLSLRTNVSARLSCRHSAIVVAAWSYLAHSLIIVTGSIVVDWILLALSKPWDSCRTRGGRDLHDTCLLKVKKLLNLSVNLLHSFHFGLGNPRGLDCCALLHLLPFQGPGQRS
jgi:hypothetical protein